MKAVVTAAVLLSVTLIGSPQVSPPGLSLRFHHLHFRTPDLSAAFDDAGRRRGGSPVLLPGLGAGVRIGEQMLLFDRTAGEQTAAASTSVAVAARYRAAVSWWGRFGVGVVPEEIAVSDLPASYGVVDHLGFAAPNVDVVAQALRAAGVEERRRTDDSLFFDAEGATIELTRETDRPDLLWCPMHPNVRASGPSKCPLCAMDLVPIPPPRVGQYRLEVTPRAASNGRGASALTFRITDPVSAAAAVAFTPVHERPLHAFIISRDLRYFAHEHPAPHGDRFELPIELPPGVYVVLADFLPAGGAPQLVPRTIVTSGFEGTPFGAIAEPEEDVTAKVIDGTRVALTVDLRPGRLTGVLRFAFADGKSGEPLRDLQPFLGASGHLLVVSTDLVHAMHAHPEGAGTGPEVSFSAEFPEKGRYKMWVQVLRDGQVITAPFVVQVD